MQKYKFFMEGIKMKTRFKIWVIPLVLLAMSACTTNYYTTAPNYDDVYYTRKTAPADVQKAKTETAVAEDEFAYEDKSFTTESYVDEEGNTFITNNYYGDVYNYDDYYDYEYAARIRRFYSPYTGFTYYHGYYTNYYWYTYDPYYWGVSIYLGYPWWRPSYYSYFNPWYYGYGWYGWYSPYYSWGYPYGYWGYGSGYWNGYWDGYYAGSGYYYYNSQDYYGNTFYYGPRDQITSTNTASGSGGMGSLNNLTFGSVVQSQTTTDFSRTILKPQEVASLQSSVIAPVDRPVDHNQISKPNELSDSKSNIQETTSTGARPTESRTPETNTIETRPSESRTSTEARPVDSRPTESRTSAEPRTTETNQARPYTSPEYSRPKSNQEYSNTGGRDYEKPNYYQSNPVSPGSSSGTYSRPSTTGNRPTGTSTRPSTSGSGSNTGTYSRPNTGTNSSGGTYTRPSSGSQNSRDTYTRPSSSGSSNSSGTYSRPSSGNNNSSGTYSRPSSGSSNSRGTSSSPSSGSSNSRGSYSSPSSGSSSSSSGTTRSSGGSSSSSSSRSGGSSTPSRR